MGLDQEIRAMVTNITNRLNELQTKSHAGRTSHQFKDDDELSVINLTGSNNGAVMKAKLDEPLKTPGNHVGEDDMVGTYVNSNCQAVNNSIMLGGSYTSEDPGVHMAVTDYVHVEEHINGHTEKEKKKKKKEGKGDEHHETEKGEIEKEE